MLLRNKFFIVSVLFILLFSGLAVAQVCQVAHARNVLKKALYSYYINPLQAELPKIKDLLNFYLSISGSPDTVDCSGTGPNSGIVFETIINEFGNLSIALPVCSDGTVYGECSSTQPKYCYSGSLISRCGICGCAENATCQDKRCVSTTTTTTIPVICSTDAECGTNIVLGYSCYSDDFPEINYDYVMEKRSNNTCLSPGTLNSSCIVGNNSFFLDFCDPLNNEICVKGVSSCQTIVTNVTNVTNATSPPVLTSGISYTGSNETGGSITFWCSATDNEQANSTLDVFAWIGTCDPLNCFNTRDWSSGFGGTPMSYNVNGQFSLNWVLPWAAGTTVAATCAAYDNEGTVSNWGDQYPFFTVAEPVINTGEIQITSDLFFQAYPDISGNYVIWLDPRNTRYEIYLYDISTNQTSSIVAGTISESQPSISGNKVVWAENRNNNWDVYMYDISSGVETRITSSSANQWSPKIQGNRIVYSSNSDLYVHDLSTGQDTQITFSARSESLPNIYGNYVIWSDQRFGNWDIFLYDLSTGQETPVTTNSAGQLWSAISGDTIVFGDGRNDAGDIYMYDISSGQLQPVVIAFERQQRPDIHGNTIVWQDNRNGKLDIYTYDMSSGTITQVTSEPVTQREPAISGNKIVYIDWKYGTPNIFLKTVS